MKVSGEYSPQLAEFLSLSFVITPILQPLIGCYSKNTSCNVSTPLPNIGGPHMVAILKGKHASLPAGKTEKKYVNNGRMQGPGRPHAREMLVLFVWDAAFCESLMFGRYMRSM